MSKSSRRRGKAKTLPQGTVTPQGEVAPVRPKQGPGQVFRDEVFALGSCGSAKRFRNIAVTPLTLAFYKGHLVLPFDPAFPVERVTPDERYTAGLEIEKLWATLHASDMRDSTDPGISSYSGLFLTEAKEAAGRRLRQIMHRMERKDFAIAVKFCGEQWPAPATLTYVGVPFNRRSIWPRICESLDALVYTTTGREPPQRSPSWPTATRVSADLPRPRAPAA